MATRKTASLILSLVVALALASGALGLPRDSAAPDAAAAGEPAPRHDTRQSTSTTSPTTAAPSTTTSTTAQDGDDLGFTSPTPPAAPTGAGDEVPQGDSVHDVVPGAGGPPPAGPTDPIGDLDDDGPVPPGFDFTSPPAQGGDPTPFDGPGALAVAPSCSHQCITSGVAYPRGFGAELVVKTSVPASLFMTVIADLDDDGDYEKTYVESTPFGLTSYSWPLDHLAPGQTYHVMATATDEHDHTSYVWGEFTTLSHRDVFVELGSAEVAGGPGNITSNSWLLGLDGPYSNVTPGQQGILLYSDLPRHVDIDFWMLRGWDGDLCEALQVSEEGTGHQGHSGDACVAWNSAFVDDVDLDVAPGGKTHWTQTSVQLSLHPPTGAGDALPPGYGDPYYFHFEVPITLHVGYS